MKRWIARIVLVVLGLLAVLVVHEYGPTKTVSEPTFGGRTLNVWLDRIYLLENSMASFNPEADLAKLEEARKAVLEIGSSAVPYLVQSIEKRDLFWYQPFNRAVVGIESLTRLNLGLHFGTARPRGNAIFACRVIGPNASGATPALLKLFNEQKTFEVGCALAAIGGDALEPVLQSATNVVTMTMGPSVIMPLRLIGALRYAPSSEIDRVAVVLNASLRSSDANLRLEATRALSGITNHAHLFLPALMANLGDTNFIGITDSIYVLRQFGPKAREALPILRQKLADPDADVCKAAEHAIKQIDPRGVRLPAATNQPPVSR